MRTSAVLVLLILSIIASASAHAYTVPFESWMGAYLSQNKIGYMVYRVEQKQFEGNDCYRVSSTLKTRMQLLGSDITQDIATTLYSDLQWNPLYEEFSMASGGSVTLVKARFQAGVIDCEVSSGSSAPTKKQIPLPKGTKLAGDPIFALLGQSVELGKAYHIDYFNPLSLSIEKLTVTAQKQEAINVGGVRYDTTVVTSNTPMGELTIWQTKDGDVIQAKAVMGITLTKESKEQAIQGLGGGSQEDFASLSSVKPDRPVRNARRLRAMTVVLSNVPDRSLMVSDPRQTAIWLPKKANTMELRIKAATFPAVSSLKLPINPTGFKSYLESSPYLDSDNAEVRRKAKEIAGSEKNAYLVCSALRKWVRANLAVSADIGITRPASDVLKTSKGVCRDSAILLGAMARSLGIPARIATGLVYSGDAFYYHAWTECHVGKWVPFDGTLDSDFVDATHIKLAEGDATTMFSVSKVIGSLRISVKSLK